VGKGSGVTRGDRRRNARRERLRELLPRDGAVIGIDLGDEKQAIAVVDHDVRVLARKTVRVKAFRLGGALDWAVAQARVKGFTAVEVACEPTGARWLQVQRLCAERGLPLVCIQPLVSHIARQQQDYTAHKSDESDCVMIARLAIELHCYFPEELDEAWAQLRHLGRRRAQLITSATASVQRVRDFLSVAWPVAPEACAHPFESVTWLAAMQVVTSRCGGQPEKLAAIGLAEFTALVRQAVAGWGGQRPASLVCRAVFAALTSTEGVVVSHRRALLRRCADELGDLQRTRAQLRATCATRGPKFSRATTYDPAGPGVDRHHLAVGQHHQADAEQDHPGHRQQQRKRRQAEKRQQLVQDQLGAVVRRGDPITRQHPQAKRLGQPLHPQLLAGQRRPKQPPLDRIPGTLRHAGSPAGAGQAGRLAQGHGAPPPTPATKPDLGTWPGRRTAMSSGLITFDGRHLRLALLHGQC
jgi:hypothetical protein